MAEFSVGTVPGVEADAIWEEVVALCAWQSERNNAENRRTAKATLIAKCIFIKWLSP
jgi:hypothetical protein